MCTSIQLRIVQTNWIEAQVFATMVALQIDQQSTGTEPLAHESLGCRSAIPRDCALSRSIAFTDTTGGRDKRQAHDRALACRKGSDPIP